LSGGARVVRVIGTTTRRAFLGAVTVAALAAPLAVGAQQPAKVWRIGLLDYASDPATSNRWKALRDRLHELGYVQGQNVLFESRWGDGQVSQLRSRATELVEARMDIIVTAGSEAALATRQATTTIPIVTATGADPVQLQMAGTLARPGGNVTGVTSMTSELGGKRLEVLLARTRARRGISTSAQRPRLNREPEHRHRLALGRWRRRSRPHAGGGARPAPGRHHHRVDWNERHPRRHAGDEDHSHRHGIFERSGPRRGGGEPRPARRERHGVQHAPNRAGRQAAGALQADGAERSAGCCAGLKNLP
jgi:hypothetical protein